MDYEQKFKIGDIVKGKRTFNGEVIEGKFNGFCLHNQLNPTSVIGVIMTYNGCYDVSVDSIEFAESEDEKIRKAIIEALSRQSDSEKILNDWGVNYDDAIDWLKSLKPRWKPTEEQLKALELKVVGRRDALYELYLDLKKL